MPPGIAPGGGLYVPDEVPSIALEQIVALAALSYDYRATAVFRLFGVDVHPERVEELMAQAYGANFDHPLVAPLEEVAAGDGSTSTIMSVHNSVGCVPILKFGSDMQKERFLKPMARGEQLSCCCLTAPGAGSDAPAPTTRAKRGGSNGPRYGNDWDWVAGRTAMVEHFDGRLELLHWATSTSAAGGGQLEQVVNT